jgi:hypothetical protein
MEMGEQQSIKLRGIDAHEIEDSVSSFANVDEEDLISGNDYVARARALRVGHRRARPAQTHMQPIIKPYDNVPARILFDCTLEQPTANRLLKPDNCDERDNDEGTYPNCDFLGQTRSPNSAQRNGTINVKKQLLIDRP